MSFCFKFNTMWLLFLLLLFSFDWSFECNQGYGHSERLSRSEANRFVNIVEINTGIVGRRNVNSDVKRLNDRLALIIRFWMLFYCGAHRLLYLDVVSVKVRKKERNIYERKKPQTNLTKFTCSWTPLCSISLPLSLSIRIYTNTRIIHNHQVQ